MIDGFASVPSFREGDWCSHGVFLLAVFGLCGLGGPVAEAQWLRVDAGGGWAFPTTNVELSTEAEIVVDGSSGRQEGSALFDQPVDLNSGRHVYVGVGFERSIGDQFTLGARLRAHTSQLRSTVDCQFGSTCAEPTGRLRAATVEGRIILTSIDWIDPYLLVGLGVVQTSVGGVTLRGVESFEAREGTVSFKQDNLSFPEVSILDAGGDVGLGAAFPLTERLSTDVEFRVAGSLPGGKENTVTTLPLTLGLSYSFR